MQFSLNKKIFTKPIAEESDLGIKLLQIFFFYMKKFSLVIFIEFLDM
ncbi:hypothetical protein [Spirochaeta dissipatitropha]